MDNYDSMQFKLVVSCMFPTLPSNRRFVVFPDETLCFQSHYFTYTFCTLMNFYFCMSIKCGTPLYTVMKMFFFFFTLHSSVYIKYINISVYGGIKEMKPLLLCPLSGYLGIRLMVTASIFHVLFNQ